MSEDTVSKAAAIVVADILAGGTVLMGSKAYEINGYRLHLTAQVKEIPFNGALLDDMIGADGKQ